MYGNEKIVCAAIWYQDLPTQEHHSCTNINKGIVICGWRHGNIIATCRVLTGKRTVTFAEDGVGEFEQGFLTSHNRFVDRKRSVENRGKRKSNNTNNRRERNTLL